VVRRIGITLSLVALMAGALALPHAAAAGHVSRAHHKSIAKHCKALRAEMGARSFKSAFGKGKHKRHAFRGCVARRGVVQKVAVRSETPATPSTDCPPGTVPEAPKPVSAFATTPTACVAAPPPTACDSADVDEDEAGEDSDDEDAAEDSADSACEQSSKDQADEDDSGAGRDSGDGDSDSDD
jgi:hypothetical protein